MSKRTPFLMNVCVSLVVLLTACGTSSNTNNTQDNDSAPPDNSRKTGTVQEVSNSSYNGYVVVRLEEQIALCLVTYYPSCGLLQPGDKISYMVTNADLYSGAISEVKIEVRAAR